MESLDEKEQSSKTTPPTSRPRKRPPSRPATWDHQKAVGLAKKGVSQKDIASVVGVSRHTVQAYLHRIRPEMAALSTFQEHLGDSLALALAKVIDLEDKVLDALNDETVLATLTTTEKERLLGRLTIAKGVTYDKWRLQTGKSTSNNSHEIQLKQVHANLTFGPKPTEAVSSGETTPNPTPRGVSLV